MRAKERFRATFNFLPLDRPWRFETLGYWTETLARWKGEGLPFWVNSDPAAFAYFRYDRWIPVVVGDHLQPGFWPRFERKRLSVHGGHEIWQNAAGGHEKVHTGGKSALPATIKSVAENMDEVQKILPLLDPDAPGRLSSLVDRASIRYAKLFNYPLGILFSGLFGTMRHILGLERFLLSIYDEPEMLHTIGRAWENLVVGVGRRLAGHRPVWAGFWEDMCYKNGMLLSPKSYREIIQPYFQRAVEKLYDQGIEFTWVDSDGDVTRLIPLVVQVGIKGMMPFEVQAGMDIRQVRKNHPDLVIFGGLDKRLLAQGCEAMAQELEQKAAPMLQSGGYFPGLDHGVPPDVSLADFRWFLSQMRGPTMARFSARR